MSKRVYGLKHATPRMKYQHMRNMMEFQADLKDKIDNPPDRHVALEEIHTLMGGNFHAWYDVVYKLRADNKNEEYEATIFAKLDELKAANTSTTDAKAASSAQREMFNWKAVSANTLRTYTTAVKDFETVTSTKVDRADVVQMARWQASMKFRKFSPNTIRTRLAAVRMISGVKYPLPKKQKSEGNLLNIEQVRAVLAQAHKDDRTALVQALTGFNVMRKSRAQDFEAHFMGATQQPATAQTITRLIKRCAKQAGLAESLSLRTWSRSGAALLKILSPTEFAFLIPQPEETEITSKKALHGINRRSNHLVKG